MKTIVGLVIGASLILLGAQYAQARGCGGGYHGGGGEHHSSESAYHNGSFEHHSSESAYHNGNFEHHSSESAYHGGEGGYHGSESGYHGSGFDTGGYHASAYHPSGAEASGYHPNGAAASAYHPDAAAASGYHPDAAAASAYHPSGAAAAGYAAGHTSLPTDGAFGGGYAGAAASAVSHASTTPWSGSVAAARGSAVRNAYDANGSFNHNWYGDHPGAWAAAGWGAGAAWGTADWGSVGTWCGWGNDVAPITYDYGNNITYQNDQVYYGDQPVATTDQYYQQAENLAQSAPAPAPQNTDWMPLGVFAFVQGDQANADTTFQLAINKSGAIAGNYYSLLTGTTAPVQGAVDKKTQRAAWTVAGNKSTVYDVGITSLTKNEAPVLVHFGKNSTQQWMLVRLQQPDQQPAAP